MKILNCRSLLLRPACLALQCESGRDCDESEIMNIINILGVNISILNKKHVLKKIEQFLTDGEQHQVVTANPEFLLEAGRDEEFFYILNKADLAISDGIGLKFAGWMMGKNIHRYTGADLIKDILRELQIKNYELRITVANWKDGLSKKEDIEKVLREKYPHLRFVVAEVDRGIKNWNLELRHLIGFQPDILFVALGAPWQEKWIYHNLPKLPSVKIAIGVGGAFDFLTDKIKRAPMFMRAIGLEWLWRLAKQPWRWRRIYNAVIIFPWKFFKWRFVCPFLYRPNVACLLYKKVIRRAATNVGSQRRATNAAHANDGAHANNKIEYKILLAERKDEPGHWQLPQGGTDGEDLMAAGARELSEEIDCDKFKPIAYFNNLWKYKFNKKVEQYKTKRHTGYKGQKQGLFIAEFTGKDEDIKINFWDHSGWKWVDSENLINEVCPARKESAEIFIEKFNEIIR